MMAGAGTNGDHAFDREELRQGLFTSSTKRRASELLSLQQQAQDESISSSDLRFLLELLFDTYPLYDDRPSRHAVEQCLKAIINTPQSDNVISLIVKFLKTECSKASIAHVNAFVLTDWCSVLLQECAAQPERWSKWGLDIVNADARALETCMSSGDTRRDVRVQGSAIVATRRALRSLFKIESVRKDAITKIVESLTTKGTSSSARNAVFLGVVAGVSARLPLSTPILEQQKGHYYDFYIREILGSRTVVPGHIANGLHDFFASFATLDEIQKTVIPPLEKALLRSPEIVLNGVVAPIIQSLPDTMDLSDILLKHLLKPLLTNVKSTNPVIRGGTLSTFESLASRSKNEDATGKVAEEILNPLKQSKVTTTEQKVLHAQMLDALPQSVSLSQKIPGGMAAVALKEPNEVAAAAEILTLSKHLTFGLTHDAKLDSSVSDAFVKGMGDKRLPVRRLWALRTGDALWEIPKSRYTEPDVLSFAQATLGKMVEIWQDAVDNPQPAAQSGLVTAAYVFTALILSRIQHLEDAKLSSVCKKASVLKQTLIAQPKPSFLLNHRIYSKINGEDDLEWMIRALTAVAGHVPVNDQGGVGDAWSQAYIYMISAHNLPPRSRKLAVEHLSEAYMQQPASIGKIIVDGLWLWYKRVELNDKDTAAMASKTGTSELHVVLKSICPRAESAKNSKNGSISQDLLQNQFVNLLILARPELVPRVSWIDLCLRSGIDPGELARANFSQCLDQIIHATTDQSNATLPMINQAAYNASADLAFVAPDTALPLLVQQFSQDLDPKLFDFVGPTEAAIFRTPEGTAYVDVLSKRGPEQSIGRNAKDYDTLKWEEELRAQLAAKKGQSKKLTADELAKVNAQLAKEAVIRKDVAAIEVKMKRGVGIIQSLATGPPTEAEQWMAPAVNLLIKAIRAGAGLILGESPAVAYIKCAERISSRLGPVRDFVGVATLRTIGTSQLAPEYQDEPLGDLVTRVLYRLRFMSEQRPLDTVTLMYCFPLIFLTLEKGGIGRTEPEEADEQILLALEFLSFHTTGCSDERLPRRELIESLIASMQRFTQHYKPIKDCLMDLCRGIAANASDDEISALVRGIIVPEISVRTSVLQAIDAEIDLTNLDFCEEVWLACHDDVQENSDLARTIWEDNALEAEESSAYQVLPYLEAKDKQLRRAAARSLGELVTDFPNVFDDLMKRLEEMYKDRAKPRVPERDEYGMPRKVDLKDPWESRDGIALTFKYVSHGFKPEHLVAFLQFMVHDGPLGDQNAVVRDEMIDAATTVIATRAQSQVEPLMQLFEEALEGPDRGSAKYDQVNEAVIILYGALGRHLSPGDERVPKVVQKLLVTLSTPSETVQYAVAECLPPLVQASPQETSNYIQQMMEQLLQSKKYAARRGAAYGLAGIVHGTGISALREYRIISSLKGATEHKKDTNQRQGAYLAFELLSLVLGRIFEPYVIQLVPQLLAGFGDSSADVREACLDASKVCFANLSSYGVKNILPTLLEGLDDSQWRSKKGACDSLGAMAYLDPQQLALSLPDIIPPLTDVLTDSHKEVRLSANRSLQRFGEVLSNPEIKSSVGILLKALSDPTKYTDDALDALIKLAFVHYLDAPSLALVVRILERGLGDRSGTKRKAAQIIGSLAHLTERKDLISHLPILVAGLRVAIVDPVPTTRATASKALGSLVEKLGEDALPDLIPSLMATLKSDSGAGDRLGSAQALSEVLAGLGTSRLEETLPTILQNVSSSKASVREGFMSLFIFLPACFGNSFANYLSKIIPPILGGLADDVESIRETALRAGRLLVKNFATRAIDLLLPELERGLADDSHRIRLSSVELVGDLLFNLTGISARAEDDDEVEEGAKEAGQSLLEVLGEEKRNKVLSALYICRCDTSGLVRTAAINVWKALVATPRTLRELIPTLTQLIIRRLASSNMEQKVIASNALGELIRKAGEGVLASLLPTLEEGLHSTDTDAKQGICIALRELIASASPEVLEDYEKTLVSVVRTALVDPDADVREAAADAFDSLQRILGKKAVDAVLPYLLNLLRTDEDAQNALSALLTLLTDNTRSNIILPNLLPTLLTSPMSAFNARAIASLAEVASSSMNRRLPNILNAIMDNIVGCKDEDLLSELNTSFDTVLLSVDEFDGLNTAMSAMLALMKHDDHRRRYSADMHLAKFFAGAEIDISRYHPDLVRSLLIAFDDRDLEVVKAAWTALNELTKRLRKEEMESLVISTRQVLGQVGVAGSNLPGFALPKGINAILPIFLQGLMNGTAEQRTQAALAISDIIDRTSGDSLRPFVTQITGPLIRVVSERSVEVKAAILFTLNNLLEKIPTYLKPFLPQLQRTFAKSLADTSSEVLRTRAAKALGTLITLTPRIDPLIAELVTGSKTSDQGVKNAMLKALFEVVSKAGANMNEASRNAILGLIDHDTGDADDATAITNARLLGALIRNLPSDVAASLIKSRVLTRHFSKSSVLALNAILLDSSDALTESFAEETIATISHGIGESQPTIATNCILAAGKYLLTESTNKSFEATKTIFEALAPVIQPGHPVDTRRLALVVVRTVSRENNDLIRPHLSILAPSIFASVRDPVIPVKLSAEAAFLAIFSVVEEEGAVFEKYMAGPGASAPAQTKRLMQDYFKRVAVRLGSQARERKEAEGGQGGLGLSSDEKEDEREVWSVGKVDLGEGAFGEE